MSIIQPFILDEHWQGGVTVKGADVRQVSREEILRYTREYALKNGPRLPHYVTAERLQRDGFTPDMIKALNLMSTPIAYAEAERRNAEERRKFEANKINAGKPYMPTYHPGRRIVKADADPKGGAQMVRFHKRENNPHGNWHASKEEIAERIQATYKTGDAGLNVRATVTSALDLPADRGYASDATLRLGIYRLELSFTASGSQQADIDPKNIQYGNTQKVDKAFKPK